MDPFMNHSNTAPETGEPSRDQDANGNPIYRVHTLQEFEVRHTRLRLMQLAESPIPGNLDTEHLKAIHKHIFQDVYPWAGEFRTTLLSKGPTEFTPPFVLKHHAEQILDSIHKHGLPRERDREVFAQKASTVLSDFNSLHPFREGNGRTQRVLISEVVRRAGHTLAFDVVSKERMIEASIRAHEGDRTMMTRMFAEISDPSRVEPLRRAVAFLEKNRFPWNNTYIATSTPGQEYAGRLVGRDRDNFMMRTDADRIIIGRGVDLSPATKNGEHFAFVASGAAGHSVKLPGQSIAQPGPDKGLKAARGIKHGNQVGFDQGHEI